MTRITRRVMVFVVLAGVLSAGSGGVAAQVEGNQYISPTYGYDISWTDEWSAEEEASEGGYDFLTLWNGVSTVYLEGFSGFNGDPSDCVDGIQEQIESEVDGGQTTILTGEDGEPMAGEADGNAYALFEYTITDEEGTGTYIAYVECWGLPGPSALAAFTAVVPAEEFDGQIAALDELIGALFLPLDDAQLTMVDLEPYVRMVQEDLTAFWTEMLAPEGLTYEAPAYISFDAPIETGCGDAAPEEIGPFYCPADRGVYLDLVMMENEILSQGQFVVAFVIAHEIGHHLQEVLGLVGCEITACVAGERSLEVELQADCLAGVWAQNADQRGLVEPGELELAVAAVASYFGDDPNTPPNDPQAHGPGALRTWWLLKGFYEGVDVCLTAENG